MDDDPFRTIREQLGTTRPITLTMSNLLLRLNYPFDNGVPACPDGYNKSECVWEYEILGLIPIGLNSFGI